jgi:hypothetical protein
MSALHTPPIPFVNPDDMEDTGAQILALQSRYPQLATVQAVSDEIAASWDYFDRAEAYYRADRERAHAHFDRHRDAALIAAGLIDAPVARTQELAR